MELLPRLYVRGGFAALFAFVFLSHAPVLQAESADDKRGFVLSETLQGNANSIGSITRLDTMAGYRFNDHFEVDAGLPAYFVRASSDAAALGAMSGNGIGNAYLRLRYIAAGSAATFVSSLTGSAPTGDSSRGFSTGRATVDWNNYLGFNAGRITPFVNAGLGNSISDTRFFTRPYTTLGKVAQFEGGAEVQVWRTVNAGASLYADVPFGEQKVYSKLVVHGKPATGNGTTSGRGKKRGVFESQSVSVGSASIARDNGGAVWVDCSLRRSVDFVVGYSRSVEYDLNSVFFSLSLNLGAWIRSRH